MPPLPAPRLDAFSVERRRYSIEAQLACRSEGLLAFVRLCEGVSRDSVDRPIFDQAAARSRVAIHENLELQLGHRRPNGSFVHGRGNSEVRIDYIQHNISSFLGYAHLSGGLPLSAR